MGNRFPLKGDNSVKGDTTVKGNAIVPYIRGVTETIKTILSNCIFAKPKDPVKTNQKTHAVYSIPCGDSEKEYLGQSKRQFGTRLKEHQKGKSALAEHVCYTKHEIAWENSEVITTNNRYGQRLCLEARNINMSNHALSRDDGAYLPEEYMHLIGS